jgi:RecA-family ATPase
MILDRPPYYDTDEEFQAAEAEARAERQASSGNGHTGDNRASPALSIFRPVDLEGRRPPARKWIVPGWIPCGVVTGLYGAGGEGKSLIAQQLQTSTAVGKPWLGLPVEPAPSLGVYCEDEFAELFRRQQDINPSYGISFSNLEGVEWLPRYGMDNVLMTFGRTGVGETTAFQRQIIEAALDMHARLVIFDTAADGFAGNENDRGQVRQFISRALGSIALKIDGSVLLLAHPSRSGLKTNNDGQVDGDGGSTGWSNTMRSRLLLSTPAGESGEPKDVNARILQRKKANYAARHDELRLRWSQGVIEPEAAEAPAGMTPFGRLDAKEVFLSLARQFDEQNRTISENARAGNYAPRAFAGLPREQRCNFKQPNFAKAMERLFLEGKIMVPQAHEEAARGAPVARESTMGNAHSDPAALLARIALLEAELALLLPRKAPEGWLSVRAVAVRLGLTSVAVYRAAREGRIASTKVSWRLWIAPVETRPASKRYKRRDKLIPI